LKFERLERGEMLCLYILVKFSLTTAHLQLVNYGLMPIVKEKSALWTEDKETF